MLKHIQEHVIDNSDSYISRVLDFFHTNLIPITTMTSGVILGEVPIHESITSYLTDLQVVELIRNYVAIFISIGGFALMIYNTFFKKNNKSNTNTNKVIEDNEDIKDNTGEI